jgi:hypothetical protein
MLDYYTDKNVHIFCQHDYFSNIKKEKQYFIHFLKMLILTHTCCANPCKKKKKYLYFSLN